MPVTVVAGAVALGISEFMTTFDFTPPGGEPLQEQLAGDRHGYAMLLLAAFAVASTLVAIATGQRAVALATAGFGVAALILFLAIELPDVNKLGDIEQSGVGLISAKAEPQPGFWLEAIGAVALGLSSIGFATLTPDQLQTPKRILKARHREQPEASDPVA